MPFSRSSPTNGPTAITPNIAGHGRLQAARAMGLAELPVITLSGLSETQKRALRIADNKIALNAGWDLEILQLESANSVRSMWILISLSPASRPARSM